MEVSQWVEDVINGRKVSSCLGNYYFVKGQYSKVVMRLVENSRLEFVSIVIENSGKKLVSYPGEGSAYERFNFGIVLDLDLTKAKISNVTRYSTEVDINGQKIVLFKVSMSKSFRQQSLISRSLSQEDIDYLLSNLIGHEGGYGLISIDGYEEKLNEMVSKKINSFDIQVENARKRLISGQNIKGYFNEFDNEFSIEHLESCTDFVNQIKYPHDGYFLGFAKGPISNDKWARIFRFSSIGK